MALQNCHECGKQVSTEATNCPNCGALVKKPIFQRNIGCLPTLFILALTSFIIMWMIKHFVPAGPSLPSLSNIPSIDSYRERAREADNKANNSVTLSNKGRKIKEKYPDWSNKFCNLVSDHQITSGMSSTQVRRSWGKPYKINTTSGAWGTHEQWVMNDGIGSDYLYFENDVLISMQSSK